MRRQSRHLDDEEAYYVTSPRNYSAPAIMLSLILKFRRSPIAPAWATLLVLSYIVVAEPSTVSLDSGFQLLYNLDFRGAQEHFAAYQQQHAADPMGLVAEAAGLLFSEFNRLGVLSTRFLARDSAIQSRPALKPDAVIYHRFNSALERAEALARPRLARNPNDRNALLAMTLVNGLRADYSALIENSKLAALHYARVGTNYAHRLLAICPDCYDAYIATGISRYLIGSMAAPVRWMLRLGGFSSDKRQGMAELLLVSERGHYLAAYARILLAIAYIREKNLTGVPKR